ncbi:hypothetical protein MWU49_08015 [Alcanivorax sp. S6407]|uniref:lipopolysaccharide kinase InaA family protein n=1 Tax=Alcanivorax sp. S6407 TaxID=2926424 RepID=UPI001FF4C947|nr:lipopolysaccharide kinase InaA family protein [Alcanivorax sp. S6407]MCK0153643.1 hypothetical protein [Alcanivorax sp. S6407]
MSWSTLQARNLDAMEGFSLAIAGHDFHAQKVLRLIPGKRMVAAGEWQGQPVVAKLFFLDQCAAGHEAAVLGQLASKGIRVPAVKAVEPHEDGSILLLEKVPGEDLGITLQAGFSESRAEQVLDMVWSLFQAGWLQTDLHFGNFFAEKDGLCCIDAGAMKPVAEGNLRALKDNLALFVVQTTLQHQQRLMALVVARMAQWGLQAGGFEAQCRGRLQRRIRQADKKWARTCTAIEVTEERDRKVYRDRSQRQEELLGLCTALDRVPVLKEGSRVRVHGNEHWIIKHYHSMGLKGRVRQKLLQSHGMISWKRGHSWDLLGIPTPRPALLVEFVAGERAGQSIIIFPRCDGQQLSVLMESDRERAKECADTVRQWLRHFHWAGLRHGDLKAQNILVNEQNAITFIDLDAANFTSLNRRADAWHQREVQRFEKNWEQFK